MGLSDQSMPGAGGGGEGGHRWGAGPLVAPHRLQKYNTKEFNPCALITKDPDSTSPRIPRSERRAGTCLSEKAPPERGQPAQTHRDKTR